MGRFTKMPLSLTPVEFGALVGNWWDEINDSSGWQDGIFYTLCAAYALVSSVALIQLIRIELRVPEYGWTTQKVFHLMNFIVNGVRAIVFGFHHQVFNLHPKGKDRVAVFRSSVQNSELFHCKKLYDHCLVKVNRKTKNITLKRGVHPPINFLIILAEGLASSWIVGLGDKSANFRLFGTDMGIIGSSWTSVLLYIHATCPLLGRDISPGNQCCDVLYTGVLDLTFLHGMNINKLPCIVVLIALKHDMVDIAVMRRLYQVCIWVYLWIDENTVVQFIGKIFIAVVSFIAALGFLLYGGRLFFMLRRFPIESKGRRKKLHESGEIEFCVLLLSIDLLMWNLQRPVSWQSGRVFMQLCIVSHDVEATQSIHCNPLLLYMHCVYGRNSLMCYDTTIAMEGNNIGWICYSHLFHLLPDTVLCGMFQTILHPAGLFYLHKQHWLHQWVDDIIDRISRTEIGNDQVLYLTGKEMIWVDEQGLTGLPKYQDLLSAFDTDASLDVLDHPVLNLIYYMLVEILPSALVLYILRKLPPKRISAQYHPIR
ncbi:hypothetical protein Pint_10928 [Pistacia integerrima]|uniref:Uncharacterized protein n=1 Tax=Pistacia integerrima TaxID=434235 RepID=A0ACC0XFT3_9ROSI|nr:hypothetical protein Pint_10928 [Pistacia integerrima]